MVATFLLMSSLSFWGIERAGLIRAHQSVCARLGTDYVKRLDPAIQKFVGICLEESIRDVDWAMSLDGNSKRNLIEVLNEKLSAIRMSHLAVYAPDETMALWTGEALDTGARAKIVEGEIIITDVLPRSPASLAGLNQGDLVIAVEGDPVQSPEELVTASGFWEILRPDETRVNLLIRAGVFQESLEPYWIEKAERTGIRVLKIPSFLPQAIDGSSWSIIQDELSEIEKRHDRLVIDLRGNSGGSFPAMLRVLGAVSCQRGPIGWLYRDTPPRNAFSDPEVVMKNDLSSERQLEILYKFNAIELIPFQQKGCFSGPLAVLTDQNTASVAEIFSQSLKERPRTRLLGWSTAGRVVMAQWFEIPGLGQDYTVSIPVALYSSVMGQDLESRGVSPDQILTDSLSAWRSARDPWIREAVRSLRYVSK